jgi:hypothetical protein
MSALRTIFHFCISKKVLAQPHFKHQINISKTEFENALSGIMIFSVSMGTAYFQTEL